MSVCCDCCVLSEVSATSWSLVQRSPHRLWCVVVCDLEKKPRERRGQDPLGGYRAPKKKLLRCIKCTVYKIDIVNNLQCFDNTLIISRLGGCQLLGSFLWCYALMSSEFICWFIALCIDSVYSHTSLDDVDTFWEMRR
jgi:hypothetical protein